MDLLDRVRVADVVVVLVDEVDRERHGVHGLVLSENTQARREQALGACAGAPDVERIGRCQSLVEDLGEPGSRGVGQRREVDADGLGRIGDERALAT